MSRGAGLIRDEVDSRDWSAERLLGAPRAIPEVVDLSSFVDGVRDQSITSSCVGQAFSAAIAMRAMLVGQPIAPPSALAIYTLARSRFASRGDEPIFDTGCRPRDAAAALAEWGVCAESRWPFDPARVNDPVPWDVLQAGADARVTGYYRCSGLDAAKQALASGYPVAFGMPISSGYQVHRGAAVVTALEGTPSGQHMQVLVGYQPGALHVLNSWGRQWGVGGFAWLSEALFAEVSFDLYALQVAPGMVT